MNALTPTSAAMFSPEAEQQVLGACLLDQRLIGRVIQRGGASLMGDPVHVSLLTIMAEKDRAGELVSPVTIKAAVGDMLVDLGGPAYLARMAAASIASTALNGYLDHLAELSHRRTFAAAIADASEALQRGEPAAATVATLEGRLIGLESARQTARPVSMMAAVTASVDATNSAIRGETENLVRSGLPALDNIVPGFYPGELTLIGGRPSMGKSAVALGIALNAARAGHTVAITSLEMTPEAMAARALSEATAHAGNAVPYTAMRSGDISEAQHKTLIEESQYVAKLPIYFLPRDYSDVGAMIAGARQIDRATGGLRLLIVDYAQLLRADGRTRYDQITAVSMALKGLAVQLHIPVIALSQLSRQIEAREDKRPVMSDLRESGQLEQDADNVIFCYRPSYYLERDQPKDTASPDAHAAWQAKMEAKRFALELIVAKQRMGRIGTAHMCFAPAVNRLWEA